MHQPCGVGLRRRCSVALHESRVTGERNRFAGVTFLQMDLQETEGGATVLQMKGDWRLEIGDWRFFIFLQLLQSIVEDDDIIGHIRRDPHKRISMDCLQHQYAVSNRFRYRKFN